MTSAPSEIHMTELEIAGYLDRGLSQGDRDRVERHLVECHTCRYDVMEAQRIIGRASRSRRLIGAAGILAVAAAATLMMRPALSRVEPSTERDASTSTSYNDLRVYHPVSADGTRSVRFTWGGAPDAISYRFTLSTSEGITVWSYSGGDTTVTVPDSIAPPINALVWAADAMLRDGSIRSTGLQRIEPAK